jgi:hypothetical protein
MLVTYGNLLNSLMKGCSEPEVAPHMPVQDTHHASCAESGRLHYADTSLVVAAHSGIVASLALAGRKAADEVCENAISATIIPATPTRIAHVSVPYTCSTVISAALQCEGVSSCSCLASLG